MLEEVDILIIFFDAVAFIIPVWINFGIDHHGNTRKI